MPCVGSAVGCWRFPRMDTLSTRLYSVGRYLGLLAAQPLGVLWTLLFLFSASLAVCVHLTIYLPPPTLTPFAQHKWTRYGTILVLMLRWNKKMCKLSRRRACATQIGIAAGYVATAHSGSGSLLQPLAHVGRTCCLLSRPEEEGEAASFVASGQPSTGRCTYSGGFQEKQVVTTHARFAPTNPAVPGSGYTTWCTQSGS